MSFSDLSNAEQHLQCSVNGILVVLDKLKKNKGVCSGGTREMIWQLFNSFLYKTGMSNSFHIRGPQTAHFVKSLFLSGQRSLSIHLIPILVLEKEVSPINLSQIFYVIGNERNLSA